VSTAPEHVEPPPIDGVTHLYVQAADVRMHVAEAGAGEPVLMLHGWPQHWYAWRGVIPLLANERRVICPDLRGFGWSDAPPGRYAKATLAADVLALLDALELDRVELIAHDWGAWIGFMLCLDHPERFRHFLALNIYTPWPEGPSLAGLGSIARLWYQAVIASPWLGAAVVGRTSFVSRLITAGAVHPAWTPQELEAFAGVLREPPRTAASVQLYRTFLTRELLPYLRGQFDGRALRVPTVLMHGTRDLAIDYRRLGRWREHAEQMSLVLREDSGHFIAEELPEAVAEQARALFSGEPASVEGS
jgi:pimeloyl-ACP methyl ester carboxylesterase